ncbi:hypothetical protein K470DRAFT_201725, partial [Piedraia hortae CBS 480.64]
DALRWVPANRNLMNETPLQTYLSALAFAPSNSIVRNSFRSETEVWPPAATDWGFELQTLRGHIDVILSITPSSDWRRLVTVSYDNTVRLWDGAGRVLKGHNSPVWCLHFSSDSETLVSGSTD